MTGTQLALGITVAAVLTGVTITAVRAAKRSGEYSVHTIKVKGGWSWKIYRKSDGELVADAKDVVPPNLFPFESREWARKAGMLYAAEKFGARESG